MEMRFNENRGTKNRHILNLSLELIKEDVMIPVSYPMVTGGPFPEVKTQPGRNADQSPSFTAEVKNE
jgi:hypothetical protein